MAEIGIDFASTMAAQGCELRSGGGSHLAVRRWRHGDIEVDTSDADDRVIVVSNLSRTQSVEWRLGDRWRSAPVAIPSFSVIAPTDPVQVRVTGPADVLLVLLPTAYFKRAQADVGGYPVSSRFMETDPVVERVILPMLCELYRQGPDAELAIEGRAIQLARLLGRATSPTDRATGGLSPYRLAKLRSYMEDRISSPDGVRLGLSELAAHAELSPYHFLRAFKQSTGETPASFVLRRRLERGRIALSTSSGPIKDVAHALGFRSPAHFTQRFKEKMGVAPGRLRAALRQPPS